MIKAMRVGWVLAALVLVVGCQGSGGKGEGAIIRAAGGGSDDAEVSEAEDAMDLEGLPTEGLVCRAGARAQRPPERVEAVVTCGEGLDCCYPCGMEGCDWVCATPESCQGWRSLP